MSELRLGGWQCRHCHDKGYIKREEPMPLPETYYLSAGIPGRGIKIHYDPCHRCMAGRTFAHHYNKVK